MPQWLRMRRDIIYCCWSFVDLVDAPPPVKGKNVIFWNPSNCHRMKRYPTRTFSLNNVEFVSSNKISMTVFV